MSSETGLAVSEPVPVRKSVRRLRWFAKSFHEQVQRTETETGNRFALDEPKLTAVFLEWLRAFEAQKPSAEEDRLPYVGFAAGLMLRTLIRHAPLAVVAKPEGADETNPAYFWPEGYVYVAYCLNIRALVLEQDFHEKQATVPELSQLRTWWSFRENVERDQSLAIAFLDIFAGDEPEWSMPGMFRSGQTRKLAGRFFQQVTEEKEEM